MRKAFQHMGPYHKKNTQSGILLAILLSVVAGGSVQAVQAAQVTATPASVSFGSVNVGSSLLRSVSVKNAGSSSVTITEATVSTAAFKITGLALPFALAAGQTKTVAVNFTPASGGSISGSMTFAVNTSNYRRWRRMIWVKVALSGNGVTSGQIAASPASVNFGTMQPGTSVMQNVTVTNPGTSSVTVSQVVASGSTFSVSGPSLPLSLGAGQRATFATAFSPASAGSFSGSLTVTSNATNRTLSIPLTGSGAAQGKLVANPAMMDFGSVVVGGMQSLSGTLTASGGSVSVSADGSNSAEFSVSGLTPPITLSAGQSVPFTVSFQPQVSGAASGTVSFVSNGASAASVTVSGSGTAAPPHSVTLAWGASTSAVTGYNAYRSSSSGAGYAKLNASRITGSLSYGDTSVQAGQTYYYVVTAVDSSGHESTYSNEAAATVPAP